MKINCFLEQNVVPNDVCGGFEKTEKNINMNRQYLHCGYIFYIYLGDYRWMCTRNYKGVENCARRPYLFLPKRIINFILFRCCFRWTCSNCIRSEYPSTSIMDRSINTCDNIENGNDIAKDVTMVRRKKRKPRKKSLAKIVKEYLSRL